MRSEPALQAADIAAYEFNKFALKAAERGDSEIDENELRKSLVNICRTGHIGRLLTAEQLRKAFPLMVAFKKQHGAGFADHGKSPKGGD
jgi:hypothetical protein